MKLGKRKLIKVTLGDVAEEISTRVESPAESGYERFVGLEHFVTGELKIKTWGTTENLISSMKVFRQGDTLFARRNVYLKRASMVDFDGLCSGDAIVLREKENMMIRGFLPLVLNTNLFWDYAIANADGSMSKRINVKTLLKYEFSVPVLEEQRRLATTLWAADHVVQKWQKCLDSLSQYYESKCSYIYSEHSSKFKCIPFSTVGRWTSGSTPTRNIAEYWTGSIPWVSPKDMKYDDISTSIESITEIALEKTNIRMLPEEAILFVVRGMILAHTLPVGIAKRELTINQDMKGIVVNDLINPLYVFHWLKSKSTDILKSTEESSHGTKRISTDIIGRMKMPCPPRKIQNAIALELEQMRKVKLDMEQHLLIAKRMLNQLCNSLLGGE